MSRPEQHAAVQWADQFWSCVVFDFLLIDRETLHFTSVNNYGAVVKTEGLSALMNGFIYD